MTFKEFCDKYPDLKVTYKSKGTYFFLVEEDYDKFIYRFCIDKKLYIRKRKVDGEVEKVTFGDLAKYSGDYCCTHSINYERFLNLYNSLYGRIVVYSPEGRIIIPTEEDLHNYKSFYINGDRYYFINSDRIGETCIPFYNYKTYTKNSFEDSIDEDELL